MVVRGKNLFHCIKNGPFIRIPPKFDMGKFLAGEGYQIAELWLKESKNVRMLYYI